LTYIFPADTVGLSSLIFLQWAPNNATFLQYNAYRQFKVIQGQWFWYQSKAHICDFLLVCHSVITFWLKIAIFSYPSPIWHHRLLCSLWNFAVNLTMRKLRVMAF